MFDVSEHPLVTVITPSYNQGLYIERTILSVAAQRKDYPNLEHLVVDAASTDGTIDVLRKYCEQVRWISERDRGFADAVNKGLALAKGTIIGIQSSDDLYAEGAVAAAVEAFQKNPQAAAVYGHFAMIDTDDQIFDVVAPFGAYSLDGYITLDFIIPQASAFFRKEAAEEVGGFDLGVDYVADMEFWLRLATKYPLVNVPRCMAYVRAHPSSRSSTSVRFGDDWRKAVDKTIRDNPGRMSPDLEIRARAAALMFDAGYKAAGGRPGAALQRLWAGLRTHPRWVLTKRRDRITGTLASIVRQSLPQPLRDAMRRARRSARRKSQGLGSVNFRV